jgi:glycosyltransferase involved in cell wall biosynthesis
MAKGADVCLVVEGSYPYVTGGVSSWLQWLMENLEELSFAVVALVAEEKAEGERRYRFPENVVSYQEFVVFDYREIEEAAPLRLSSKQWKSLSESLYRLMTEWREGRLSPESIEVLRDLVYRLSPRVFRNFFEDEPAFALLTRLYEEFRGEAGFLKYFYNVRNIHLILYRLLTLLPRVPEAAVFHSPGTGYGGLLTCLKAALEGRPGLITEHGIYLQEREMELLKSEWLDDPYLKEMWIDSFSALCLWQYNTCDRIVTLFEGNRRLEEDYGADPGRIQVIPNGIDVARFLEARRERCRTRPRTVGFVGRVDDVKDIKTFIQVVAIIKEALPDVRALAVGPTDDQPRYFRECRDLVRMLGLEETLTFTGPGDVIPYYRQMDLLLLTSIKEAMPLAVMEAMASGLPVVATDVGACRELLLGGDDGFGEAGAVRRVMDAEGIAEAALAVLRDETLADRMARSGIRRIENRYREDLVLERYRDLYRELVDERHRTAD